MRHCIRAIVLLTLFFLPACVSSRLQRQAKNNLIQTPPLHAAYVGICIYDPESGKYLYRHDDDKYFTPASNTKIYTLYTGMNILHDSSSGIRYLIKDDTLFIQGTGDPSLLHPDFKSQSAWNFLQASKQPIVFTNPVNNNESLGPGWPWDDYNESYQPERSPMPLYGNVVWFRVRNHRLLSMPAYFAQVRFLQKESNSFENRFYVKRMLWSNLFHYKISTPEDEDTQQVPFMTNDGITTAELLSDTLHRRVIYTAGARTWKNAQQIKNVPLDSLLQNMMHRSDNFYAEQMLAMCSATLFDTIDTHRMIRYMLKTKLRDLPDAPRWVDGSGLSRYNLFTPRDMITVLTKLYRSFPTERLYRIFPEGGTGTLSHLYLDMTDAIHAKTGSLSNNAALSGYLVTRKGRLLIFSLMVNHYVCPAGEVRLSMERFLREVWQKL